MTEKCYGHSLILCLCVLVYLFYFNWHELKEHKNDTVEVKNIEIKIDTKKIK